LPHCLSPNGTQFTELTEACQPFNLLQVCVPECALSFACL